MSIRHSQIRLTGIVRQRGLALVIVIWILTLLTLMAGSFATTMRRETSISAALKGNAEAQAEAESAIMLAQFMLVQSDPEQRWQVDGSIYRLLRANGEIRVRIVSEAGKVDINAAGEQPLSAVLKAVISDDWQQQRLLNAILDWRDADDDTRTLGAEKRQYRLAGLNYAPTNSPFQSLEELQLVLGMNEAIFTRIRPWITVYSGNGEVNLREASPELLTILGNELDARNIHDQALQAQLNAAGDDNNEPAGADDSFMGENRTYTITAEARFDDDAAASLEVIVQSQGSDGDGSTFEVLDWKQNPQDSSLFDDAMEYRLITVQDEFTYNDRP